MANVTLGQIYNALKAVADWVGGTLPYKPKVVANGSNDGGGNITPLKTDVNGNLEVKSYGTDGTTIRQLKTDTSGNLEVKAYGTDGTTNRQIKTDTSGNMQVVLASTLIPQTQAVPTRVRTWERIYDTGASRITVAANSVAAVTIAVDPATIDKLLASVYADASHSWRLYLSMSPISSGSSSEAMTKTLIDVTNSRGGYTSPAASIDYYKSGVASFTLAIQNRDSASSHTYELGVAVR